MKPQVNDLEKYGKFFKELHRDEHKCLVWWRVVTVASIAFIIMIVIRDLEDSSSTRREWLLEIWSRILGKQSFGCPDGSSG